MRAILRALGILAVLTATPAPLAAQDLIPDRRIVLSEDTDLPGGDLQTILDTTLEACERACLSNAQCTALTFNSRNGSCFPKADPGAAAPYRGAYAGRVIAADAAAKARAAERAGELAFLSPSDLQAALRQARDLGRAHLVNGLSGADLAAAAGAEGDPRRAANLMGAAANATDSAEHWVEYARILMAIPVDQNSSESREFARRAATAAVNAYLRASGAAIRHNALLVIARGFERAGRGRDGIPALRLAQQLQPRDDTAASLDRLVGLYGFRIEEHMVESDLARPRVCAVFTEQLIEKGFDYTPYVQLPEPGLTVEPGEWRQLCVAGLTHGKRYTLTFREGLPAANGEAMAKSVAVTAYVRDRNPGVRFPGRGYVLPRTGQAALPVETVNTTALDLELYRVSDRNLLRSIQNRYFGTPMEAWRVEDFGTEIAEKLWSGSAEVPMEVNRDVTTRLPLDAALEGLPAGIYALKAEVPGTDPYDVPRGWQWFVISDLGMTTLSGVDGLHVFVRSLATAGAKAGVEVALFSRANRELGRVTTDDQGHARFPEGLTRGTGSSAPGLVTVTEGDTDTAFLSLTDPEFDLSDRGVEGREAAPPIDVFLTTDRGAYRAGETVHATALARDSQAAAITGLPLTAVLKRPDGVEYSRALVPDAGAGGHVFSMPIAGSAPRGVWRMEVLADPEAPPLTARTFLVEDFLPERIDFNLTLADTPLTVGGVAELGVDARYLFGAPGAGLAIEGEAILRAADGLAAFPGYRFGRADDPFNAVMEPVEYGQQTGDDGTATVTAVLPDLPDPGRPLEARIRLRLSEGSGRPVEREVIRPVRPAAAMIGIRPGFDGVVAEGAEARFSLLAVSPDLTPTAMPVKWRLDRIETRYQWYSQYGDWNWEPVTTRARVAEGEAALTAAGPAEIAVPVQWGEYELTVERADGTRASSALRFSAGWYAAADTTSTPDTLELSLDKPAYAPGDTARLRLVPRAAGTALVTVLSNRLIAMKAVEVAEGENLIDLPVTDDWGAGVYVTASVLRPMDAAAGRLPARAIGLAHAAIDPGKRRLDTVVEVAAESDPRAPLDIAVKVEGVQPGETAYVTVAAVDVGILNLTAFKSPDPAGHYFGQRKLGVGIRDLYGRLIDGMNGATGAVRSGGDAGLGARLQAPPPTEELVAYFTGPVEVGADGHARVSFDLPAFNGTVRVMAVAWSPTGVGQAEADVLVRDPVVVTASLPRFLDPRDESRLLLEIHHTKGPAGRMSLDVTAEGLSLGPVPSGVDLAEGGKAVVSVPVSTGVGGVARLEVVLTTPDGRRLTKTLALPVQVNDPETVRVSRFDLGPGQTLTVDRDIFAGLLPGSATATLAAGPVARFDAPGLLAALDRYPYGCTEQVTSRALPLLYFDQVARAMDLPGAGNLRERIGQAVAEVLLNQTTEGGFGLWSADYTGDLWLDSYVTDFLSRARVQGFEVPQTAFRAALDNLRTRVNYTEDFEEGGGDLAYALMVLAREGAAAIGDLRYYADVKGDAFTTPIGAAQLGAALAMYGDQPRADAMFARAARLLAGGADDGQVWRADYGTALRDSAAVLALATESGSNAVDRAALTERIAARAGHRALSTQEAAWTLLATHALIGQPGAEGLVLDGTPVAGPLVRLLDDAAAPVTVANTGSAATQLTVSTFGVSEVPEPASGNGYAIRRSHYTLEGEETTPDHVAPGTRLVTVIEVDPFADTEARLVITDPLPAGWEIDNPNLLRDGQVSALDWLELTEDVQHAEFRQDRFVSAVDQRGDGTIRLAYIVRAVTPGSFHHPAASVEDMYRPAYRAHTDAGRVIVAE
ncbi:alpha-2-macroglobulin family protein [Ruixingdingia sedimenti]|uniref:Alpha-2-macroglobulin family protein n=1 Tax=Ruixingdingia sedimenti TaxID=3073604 RepID=A0ABU1F7A4_9RHOB|nr:alpha-2-macroglobulin family protein [Xinfangfangia sp. LG-4]MDR5652747.1 alpha-2-macroglobulin family protein [Xinfangfangia sp. LG-4]